MSKKIIAIIGITGNQGASVADTFLHLPNWHVRGISRDPTKPSAREWIAKGAEVVAGDLDSPSSLEVAFRDAHVIFSITDFWQHMAAPSTQERAAKEQRTPNEVAYDLEFQQGKNVVDAVAAANRTSGTLERFVFSILSDTKGLSKGKFSFNLHFDAKWAAVEYLRERHPDLDKKTSLLQLGLFATNWKAIGHKPEKQGDGTYRVSLPIGGDARFPMVDPRADTGELTKGLVEVPAGKNLVGAGSVLSWNEWCESWGKANGVKCTFERMDRKVIEEMWGPLGRELADMFEYMEEFGYDGGDPSAVYPWDLGVEIKVTTMDEYNQKEDWSSIL